MAARTDAPADTAMPTRITGTAPTRSVRRPEIGDRPYIPRVWPLITIPTAARSWPISVMWSGVIVITRTITTWTVISATIATGTFGRRRTDVSEAAVERSFAGWSWRDVSWASAYGSGRRATIVTSAAAPTKTTGTR